MRELVHAYIVHSEKKGVHGYEALVERYQTLAGLVLYIDRQTGHRATKPSEFPGFVDVPLPDGRKIGDCTVSELKPHVLEDWILDNPRWRSSSTRKAKCNQVQAVLNWAWNGRRIADNPFRGISFEEAERRPCLDDAFLEEITRVANKEFDELCTFLRLSARRLGEICRMNWEDVDWKRAVVRVTKFKGRRHVKKDQYFALCPQAVELLERIRRRFKCPESGPVFFNARGKRWTPGNASQYLRRLRARHKLEGAGTIHGIRHQAISEMVRNSGNLKAASLQAGHASTFITEKVYVHMEHAWDQMRDAMAQGVKGLLQADDSDERSAE